MNANNGIAFLEATAVWANQSCVPQPMLNLHLAELRKDLGKQNGLTDEYLAVVMGMTTRNVYLQRQKYKKEGFKKEMQEYLVDGRDPVDRILEMTRPGKPVSALHIMRALTFSMVKTEVIIKHGLDLGVLRAIGNLKDSPDGTQQYEATGKQLQYPSAKTPAEREMRSLRALKVARDCREEHVYWCTTCSLTNEGVQRVLKFLDPETQEASTLEKLESHEGTPNFGVLLTFTEASSEDNQRRDPVYRAINSHVNPENGVLRTTGFLEKKAQAAFAKKEAPEIQNQIEAMLKEAGALGDGLRRDFTFSFVFVPLVGVKGE